MASAAENKSVGICIIEVTKSATSNVARGKGANRARLSDRYQIQRRKSVRNLYNQLFRKLQTRDPLLSRWLGGTFRVFHDALMLTCVLLATPISRGYVAIAIRTHRLVGRGKPIQNLYVPTVAQRLKSRPDPFQHDTACKRLGCEL